MRFEALMDVLRGRLYPTLTLVAIAPAIAAKDSGDTGEDTCLRHDVACFAKGLFEDCPRGAAAARELQTDGKLEGGGAIEEGSGLDTCELQSVDGLASSRLAECCYEVTLECTRVVGCGCGGRPLRVERRVVRPLLIYGPRRSGPAPHTATLDPVRRATLAAWWGGIGVSEHASVASFRRFRRSLRGLRAPPGLLDRAERAIADEARHARLAFGIAGAYAGAGMRAGPMVLGRPRAVSLEHFAAETARDGGVEELRSLVLLAAIAEEVREPAVAEVLETIIQDELDHVLLAWDTVQWSMDTGGEKVREQVRRALAEPTPKPANWPDDPVLAAHGLPRREVLVGAFLATQALLAG